VLRPAPAQQHEALKTLLGGLERGLVGTLTNIGSITEDQALSDTEKVTRIRALLATGETRRLLEEDPVAELKASLVSELDKDDYYKILELKSVWIQNRVSPILKALTFQGDPGVRKLVDAIEHFKEKDGGVDRSAPTGFLDPEEQTAVNRDGKTLLKGGDDGAVIVPGNHDRLGDDVEAELMPGKRVQVSAAHGLWMVRCNSTGPHNRRWWDSHGLFTPADLQAVVEALDSAPAGSTRVLLLHHHLLPLPEEHLFERLVSRLGWPNAAELPLGVELLRRVRHRCELVLHGHRHAPAELRPFTCEAPLRVFNGGSSTELHGFRVFDVDGRRVDTCWIDANSGTPYATRRIKYGVPESRAA